MFTLPAMQICAELEKVQSAEGSVFDLAEGPGKASEDSVFDKINTAPGEAIDLGAHGYYTTAKLVTINKITAKSRELTIEIGKSAYFDNIELKLHKCWKSSDPYIKNNQILVTVLENKFDEDQKLVFEGWLISSEPALSTFEHPVYEVMATDCLGNKIK